MDKGRFLSYIYDKNLRCILTFRTTWPKSTERIEADRFKHKQVSFGHSKKA